MPKMWFLTNEDILTCLKTLATIKDSMQEDTKDTLIYIAGNICLMKVVTTVLSL